MSNLVPEVRVNKNGVPVVKHVNPDKKSGTARDSKSLPAPAVTSKDIGQERLGEVLSDTRPFAELLKNFMERPSSRMTSDKIKSKTFATLHPDTLDLISESLGYSSPDKPQSYVFERTITYCLQSRSFSELNNAALILKFKKEEFGAEVFKADMVYHQSAWEAAGLQSHSYVGDEEIDWSTVSEAEQEKLRALVKAMSLLGENHKKYSHGRRNTSYIKSQNLHNLILEMPQKVELIAQLVNERDTKVHTNKEIENFRGLLAQESHGSLASGLL